MGIHELTVCAWTPAGSTRRVLHGPSWPEVDAAIRALNNADRHDLYLQARADVPEAWLAVCGGAGRYLVTGSLPGEVFPTLRASAVEAPGAQVVSLFAGGQQGEYPARFIVTLEEALEATREYFDSGRMDGAGWGELGSADD